MDEYPVGDTVVLIAEYYSETDHLMDPETDPVCEVHDSRGRAIQTNVPVTKVTTGTYNADFATQGLTKGVYSYIFTTSFDGKPSVKDGKFMLKTV